MARLVERYAVSWNAIEGKGKIGIWLAGDDEPRGLTINSAADMAALGVVLAQAPILMDGDVLKSRWEHVPEEAVGT